MNNKKTLLLLCAGFLVLLLGAYVLYDRLGSGIEADPLSTQPPATSDSTQSTDSSQPPEALAPDFTVFDKDGQPHRLSDHFGKPIVLNFWASWCGPCQMEMPDFQQAYLELGGDIHFLMINMTDGYRETVDTASSFLSQQGYTFPVYFDRTTEAAIAYQAYSLPTTYFIDAEGHVIARATGAIDAATLQRGIDMITAPASP